MSNNLIRLDMSTPKKIARFIATQESGIYSGENEESEQIVVNVQKGVGLVYRVKHHAKPNWWEVSEYDSEGYLEYVTYEAVNS